MATRGWRDLRGPSDWSRLFGWVAGASFLCACLCVIVLDVATMLAQPAAPWYTTFQHPGQSLVSAVVVCLAVLVLVCLTNRLWLSFGVAVAACIVVAAASVAKFRVRQEPLYPSDLFFLTEPGFLFDMASPLSLVLVAVAVAVVIIVVAAVIIGRRMTRVFPRVSSPRRSRAWWTLLGTRATVAAVSIGILLQAPQFNDPGNGIRRGYEMAGAEWQLWRQAENFAANGFVGGFLFNSLAEPMSEPADYSAAMMRRIAERYTRRADELNAGRPRKALDDVNVVVVLSETFSDPGRLRGVELAEDPLPFIRKVMATHPSGQVANARFGGGTDSMEFEVLTGMSLALVTPQLSSPYQQFVPAYPWFPSAARYFADRGHATLALHPHDATMYRRGEVYPRLGIQDFVDITRVQDRSTIGDTTNPSDAATYREVLRLLQESAQPAFMNVVTMQNHFPFGDRYGNPISSRPAGGELGQYARGLAHSDGATRSFFAKLRRSEEKTLVLFYGDHLPGAVYGQDVMAANSDQRLSETPFFLWSSYQRLPAIRLDRTGPEFFMPLLFDAVDAPLPPYYALLRDLHQEVPGLSRTGHVDPSRLTPQARLLLHDFNLVQFDFSAGRRYATRAMFHSTP
jgi:hypothetical protein